MNKHNQRQRENKSPKAQSKKVDSQNLANAKPIKTFEIPEITTLQQSFHRQIEVPIQFQTSVFATKTPQRCIAHNNVITLYCINDRKPLCVTCMYQSSAHRKHKVIPLNRAKTQMQEDMKNYVKIVERQINIVDVLIKKSNENAMRVQDEFPRLIKQLNQFYINLHQILVQKQNQHVKHLQQAWNKMKFEYKTYSNELIRMNYFIVQKLKDISEKHEEENLLLNRNLLHSLAKTEKIFEPDMCTYHETKYYQQIKNFEAVTEHVNKNLILTSAFNLKVSRKVPSQPKRLSPTNKNVKVNSKQASLIQSPSFDKRSQQMTPKKSDKNFKINIKTEEKPALKEVKAKLTTKSKSELNKTGKVKVQQTTPAKTSQKRTNRSVSFQKKPPKKF